MILKVMKKMKMIDLCTILNGSRAWALKRDMKWPCNVRDLFNSLDNYCIVQMHGYLSWRRELWRGLWSCRSKERIRKLNLLVMSQSLYPPLPRLLANNRIYRVMKNDFTTRARNLSYMWVIWQIIYIHTIRPFVAQSNCHSCWKVKDKKTLRNILCSVQLCFVYFHDIRKPPCNYSPP